MGNRIYVNKNVIFSKFQNGKKYILVKHMNKYIPMLFRQDIINLLEYIRDTDIEEASIIDTYGEELINDISILKQSGIIVKEKSDVFTLKNIDYENRIGKVNTISFNTRTPLVAKIELTYICNYKCKYCYVEDIKQEMLSYEEIDSMLKTLKANGVNELFLTGGEPFLHPDILKIINLCDELGLITTIQTNGSFINKNIAEYLSKYNHLTIAISFHSSNEVTFDEFTGIKGAFQNTMKASMYLKENNINYFFKVTVTSSNEKEIETITNFLENGGIPFNIYTQILPNINDCKENSDYSISEDTIKWLYDKRYLNFNKNTCSAARGKLWISPNGDVYPCELVRVKLGNLVKDDFTKIWNGDEAQKVLESNIYKDPEKCCKCSNKDWCNHCLAYLSYKSWGSGLNQFCKTAKIVRLSTKGMD